MRAHGFALCMLLVVACAGPSTDASRTATGTPAGQEGNAETTCSSDDDCEMMTPCCACPALPRAMNRTAAEAERQRCMIADCVLCDAPTAPAPPLTPRCQNHVCVGVP